MEWFKRLWRNERTRHALIAAALAALLGGVDFFEPLRPVEWRLQTQVAPRTASGQIVFIEASDNPSDPTKPQGRRETAALINQLTQAGAQKIFVNVIFDRPSTAEADEALRKAIAQSGRTILAQRYMTTFAGESVRYTLPRIAGSAPQAVDKAWVSTFGYNWSEPYSAVTNGALLPSLPAAIAEKTGFSRAEFPIDYSIDYRSIPSFTMHEAIRALSTDGHERPFAGKMVVIGDTDSAIDFASIPGRQHVPPTLVTILAAETLKIGPPIVIGWLLPLLAAFALLVVAILALKRARRRRVAYAAVAASLPAMLFPLAYLRLRGDLATPLAFLLIYATLRLWHMRQRKASLVDEFSGLPSFRKLGLDLAERGSHGLPSVVVAKIHRFDEVLSSLPSEHHREYVRLVAERIRIGNEELVVYSNGGRYLAWLQLVEDEEYLQAHLNGLRAMFAHPLHLAGTALDVGITFGADATSEGDPARRIAAAISAAERTTEAHSPVLLARESSEADRLWNVSLQAKIDQALKSGEIYVVYQPQFELATGAMLGAEALVRWNDHERGPIAPSYFIEQCEQVGRMDALTRKVFEEAVAGIASSPLANAPFQLSMNVSATLLHDFRVVEMLREILSFSPLPASRLTLEITETSRITDYDTARLVMDQLHKLGVKLSIDDFGVGAASLETLLRLPFDELKIDRMFVSLVRDNAKARGIVESLVNLGLDLGIVVLAEGVEDAATLAVLKQVRCDAAQGYFLGRPGKLDLLLDHPVGSLMMRS